MFVVGVYDIPDDKRRGRVARILDDVAVRVQYSVFEGQMDEETFVHLLTRLEAVIVPEQDRVRIYRICATCKRQTVVLGQGKILEIPDVIVL